MAAGDVGYQLGWWLLWARPAVVSSRHGLHRVGLRLLLRRIAPHADHQGRILQMPDGSFQTCRN